MPRSIERSEVERLMEAGVQVVEVLARDEYDEWHLPGAIHLSLSRVELQAQDVLDPSRPVIVYCWDSA